MSPSTREFEAAARAALRAPSVLNTQPWRWRITADTLELYADVGRQLSIADPYARRLLISCGTALHHARTALAATGHEVVVERIPAGAWPALISRPASLISRPASQISRPASLISRPASLISPSAELGEQVPLARLRLGAAVPADPGAGDLAAAIPLRRTDRRGFSSEPVSDDLIDQLRRAVEHEGAHLRLVPREQIPLLALAGELANETEAEDPAFRQELIRWTSRPAGHGDGVPPGVAVRQTLRRVPVRDLAPLGGAGLTAGRGNDRGAAYVILYGPAESPLDLLRAGEALSALLLLATSDGLATEPFSEAAEVAWPRRLLGELLGDGGIPFLAVRLGHPATAGPLPPVPRRDAGEVITIE
ncbi:Acg family FMN-binding oxidoreductase [Winogradskya humida]|uniref:NAD(P)H nitroreductase n=1 Tax=Winogradskya humida TaxID=113566 RepID=A0ABQ4A3V2_9ACTN|nr:nitroreductase [Actinoplanes humidus]GIE25535.1 NAD(P)H nitroreductase [Actinoplanes humidus]